MQAALAVKERELAEEKRRSENDSRSSVSSSTRYTPSPVSELIQEEQLKDNSQLKSMITRLMSLEEELHREKRKMADKQKVIEAQVQTIQALDAANNRLLSALAQLRSYQPVDGSADSDDMVHISPVTASVTCGGRMVPLQQQQAEPEFGASLSLARRILADLGEVQSSSC